MFKEDASLCGSDRFAKGKERWQSQSNSGLRGKERKEKEEEKARQGHHLKGVIGRGTDACSVREGLVEGPSGEEPPPDVEVLSGARTRC